MYLASAIFYNRAPLDNLRVDFLEKGVNVLTAINGMGKTTILSHIADAFFEMARDVFTNSFEGKENKYYRLSSSLQSLDQQKESFVYLRFKENQAIYDYIDYRNGIQKDDFSNIVPLDDKIDYHEIKERCGKSSCIKLWSKNLDDDKKRDLFENNLLTYFPSYRFEYPSYLNTPYKTDYFNEENHFAKQLPNPIENISSLNELSKWIMNVVLDKEVNRDFEKRQTNQGGLADFDVTPELKVWKNLNGILNDILASRTNNASLRFGISRRNVAGQRIAVMQNQKNGGAEMICPHISQLSSGELSLLCLFGEMLRQGDCIKTNFEPHQFHGIVLIDEIEENLHIRMQKEVLPRLFAKFPNIQFIVSSHSPFFGMGLAVQTDAKSQFMDLENGGVIIPPTNNSLYNEVYQMMLGDNKKYADLYFQLKKEITKSERPLIVTEGKTDVRHIRHAMKRLNKNFDLDFFDLEKRNWGDSNLWTMLSNLSLIPQKRKVIGIFDRDTEKAAWGELLNLKYKKLGVENSNVFAFCIPLVNEELYGKYISIEHYYEKQDLLKKDNQGRRLFLGSEFYESGNSKDSKYQTKISNIQHKVNANGIIDDKVFKRDDLELVNPIALSKKDFAEMVENDESYSGNFDYSKFECIFEVIQEIIDEKIE